MNSSSLHLKLGVMVRWVDSEKNSTISGLQLACEIVCVRARVVSTKGVAGGNSDEQRAIRVLKTEF
jgi:hypothetical protein